MDRNNFQQHIAHMAQVDFQRARRRAFLNKLVAGISRRPGWLLSFDDVQKAIPLKGQRYRGFEQVPITAIVGSVDRYHDFDRGFLPTQSHTRPRWESVDRATLTDVILPPVQLYKIGEVYFVKDGNHRVSVAKGKGAEYIDAEVIELPISVPLSPDTDPRDLLRLGEYARFLEQTKLDVLRPGACIEFTSLGRYDVLLEHISAHRWYMGIDQDRPVSWEEAVLDWYDNVYLPVVKVIEETNVLEDFPGRTPGDLYLWIMDHGWYLHEETGADVGPREAASSYNAKHASWTRKVVRYLRRLERAATAPLALTAQHITRALRASKGEGEK
jgi:hypothetical protein